MNNEYFIFLIVKTESNTTYRVKINGKKCSHQILIEAIFDLIGYSEVVFIVKDNQNQQKRKKNKHEKD